MDAKQSDAGSRDFKPPAKIWTIREQETGKRAQMIETTQDVAMSHSTDHRMQSDFGSSLYRISIRIFPHY